MDKITNFMRSSFAQKLAAIIVLIWFVISGLWIGSWEIPRIVFYLLIFVLLLSYFTIGMGSKAEETRNILKGRRLAEEEINAMLNLGIFQDVNSSRKVYSIDHLRYSVYEAKKNSR
jgi:hypothetical protein